MCPSVTPPPPTPPPPPSEPTATRRYVLGWLAAVALVILAVYLIALVSGKSEHREDDSIPVPPPGYQYCSNGYDLKFCPKGDAGEYR